MGQTVTFSCRPNEDVVAAITTTLARRNYRVVRSFDLQSAQAGHAERGPCPHHGTSPCACQYVVLLVYPQAGKRPNSPHVLTAHSYEQMTLVTFHRDAAVAESESSAIGAALIEAVMRLAPPDPAWIASPA